MTTQTDRIIIPPHMLPRLTRALERHLEWARGQPPPGASSDAPDPAAPAGEQTKPTNKLITERTKSK